MAKKSSKTNPLAAKIKNNKARAKSRTAAPEVPRGGSLPPGIDNGVAKLTKVEFKTIEEGKTNAGELMLYTHGICVNPTEITNDTGKIRVAGSLVQPGMIILADTESRNGKKTTFTENFEKAENLLKLIGFPTEDFEDETFDADTLEHFKEMTDAEEPMYFRFRTWQGKPTKEYPNPSVNVSIMGPAENFEPAEDEEMEDDTEEEEEDETEEEEEEETPAPKKASGGRDKKPPAKKAKPEPEEEEDDDEEEEEDADEEEEEEVDLLPLAKKADKGDEEAQSIISEASEAVGIDPEDAKYDSWLSVAKATIAKKGEQSGDDDDDDEEEEEEAAAEVEPAKTEIYGYQPPRSKKVKECEVTKVLKRAKTVTIKSLEGDDKVYTEVPWSALIVMEEGEE